MDDFRARKLKPEEKEIEKKRTELSVLEVALAEKELALLSLRQNLQVFESAYVQCVGTLYSKLDSIEAEICGVRASLNPNDIPLRQAANDARENAAYSAEEVHKTSSASSVNVVPNEEIKKFIP